jgi:hypothetical protein
MSFESIANSITTYFHGVATANNFVVRFDNDPRDTPADRPWIQTNVDFGDSRQFEIGVSSFRNVGIFNAMIYISIGQGIAGALSVADVIASAFRTTVIDGTINFQTPRIVNVGRVDDNWQVSVLCPFFVDEN